MRAHSGITDQGKASMHRSRDAQVLAAARRWRGAMYLLGYAVECSLKAKLMERYDVRRLEQLEALLSGRLQRPIDLFQHSLQILMDWTEAEHRMDRVTRAQWGTVRRWRVDWRYNPMGAESDWKQYSEAVDGVLRFIRGSV